MPSSVNTKAPTKQMWRRSVVVLVLVVGLCFSVLIGNLGVIQLGQAAFWQQKAMAQQLSDSVISPNRGSIYDANMQLLAGSAEVGTIIMSPNNIPDDATREKIATDLSA
ncbi:MAG: hypothetical protein FWF49_04795, partial [Oscillospiraceae bacterium]|nr:hypothetical protein [Oscillospiraceae bacterium]